MAARPRRRELPRGARVARRGHHRAPALPRALSRRRPLRADARRPPRAALGRARERLRPPARALPRVHRDGRGRAATPPSRARATSRCSTDALPRRRWRHEPRGDRHRLGLRHRARDRGRAGARRDTTSASPGTPTRPARDETARRVARRGRACRRRAGSTSPTGPGARDRRARGRARRPLGPRRVRGRQPPGGGRSTTTPDGWRRALEVNLTGPFLCAQAAARRLVAARRGGRIVYVTSVHEHAPLRVRGRLLRRQGGARAWRRR